MRAELLYKTAGFYVGPNIEWVPEAYFVDSANTLKTKGLRQLGAKLGYDKAGGPFSAYVEARNLTDEVFISSVSIIDCVQLRAAKPQYRALPPGNGRAVYAGMKYRW